MLRFSPNHTRPMHIGDLRIALLNYIVSIQTNEDLIIRINDINIKKNMDERNKEILEILNLFSIKFKNATYQSDNLKYYSQFGMQLLIDKKAFNCFCGVDVLQKEKNEATKNNAPYKYSDFCENLSDAATIECDAPFTVRLKKPKNNIKFSDVMKGDLEYSTSNFESFIILTHDKTPTNEFACSIDDMINNISTIIRSEEYIDHTFNEIHIRNIIGYDKQIKHIHIPIMNCISYVKESKENMELSSVKWLIEEGYLPSAIANYLILIGYNAPKEIFTIEEAIEWFDISKISKTPVKFEINKLNSINKRHIKEMDELRLSKIISYCDKDMGILAKLYLSECNTIKEIKTKINAIFAKKEILVEHEDDLKKITSCIINAPHIYAYNEFKNYIAHKTSLNDNSLDTLLTYAITGAYNSPDLNEIYPLIKNYIGEIICLKP